MNNHIYTFKIFPAGTIIESGKKSFIERLFNLEPSNTDKLYILPTEANLSLHKRALKEEGYYAYIPVKPYSYKEQIKLSKFNNTSSLHPADTLAIVNIIRPNTITSNLDECTYYSKVRLTRKDFYDATSKKNSHILTAIK